MEQILFINLNSQNNMDTLPLIIMYYRKVSRVRGKPLKKYSRGYCIEVDEKDIFPVWYLSEGGLLVVDIHSSPK